MHNLIDEKLELEEKHKTESHLNSNEKYLAVHETLA
jgi:hypothetical protein